MHHQERISGGKYLGLMTLESFNNPLWPLYFGTAGAVWVGKLLADWLMG